ncbi:hypothetical protein FT637_15960 [Bacillus cereus]|nr:hypothetical protein [Bacillus cereus]
MFENKMSEEAKRAYEVEEESVQRIADALGIEVNFGKEWSISTNNYYRLKCHFREKGSAKLKKELASHNWIKDRRYRAANYDGLVEHFTFVMEKIVFIGK